MTKHAPAWPGLRSRGTLRGSMCCSSFGIERRPSQVQQDLWMLGGEEVDSLDPNEFGDNTDGLTLVRCWWIA